MISRYKVEPSAMCRVIRTVYADELPARLTMLEITLLLSTYTLDRLLATVFSLVIDRLFRDSGKPRMTSPLEITAAPSPRGTLRKFFVENGWM